MSNKHIQHGKVLKRHGYFLLYFAGIALVAAVTACLIMPKSYRAVTTIFRPLESKTSLEWIKAASEAEKGHIQQLTTNMDLFLSILKSRSMQDKVIETFNLTGVYNTGKLSDTREILERNTRIDISRENMITIAVRDRDPVRSADIANFYADNLDMTIQNLNVSTAKRNRLFIEEGLEETRKSLAMAEQKLNDFQVKNKVLASGKTQQVADIAGELQSRLLRSKAELGILKVYTTSNHPDIVRLKSEIEQVEDVISKLPPIETELAGLAREVEIQEAIYSFLAEELEQAKIAEAKDVPVVQVLDQAIVPDTAYRPDMKLNFAVAGILILSVGVILFFFDAVRFIGNL